MFKALFLVLVSCFCIAKPAGAASLSVNWEDFGGVDAVLGGGASISFSPIQVQSFESISTSGYWTNLVDTRFSSLRAEIRLHIDGNWQTVAFNDHVRGAYGSVVNLVGADFEILPNDLSFGLVDGIMIAPDSVIYSGLGGLNSGDGTNFSFSLAPIPEPQTWALLLTGLFLIGVQARSRKTSITSL